MRSRCTGEGRLKHAREDWRKLEAKSSRTKNEIVAVRPEPVESTPPSRPVDWFSAEQFFSFENSLSVGPPDFA
jgi:hypothetical protein